MTLEQAVATPASESVDNGRALDALLSGPGESVGIAPEEETQGGASADEQVAVLDPQEEQDPAAAEETPAEEAETTDEEESALTIDDGDRDYSDALYKRAAAYYSKKYGMELDPANASHRAMLRDRLEELDKANQPAATPEKEALPDEPGKPAEEPAAAEAPLTEEQIVQRYDNVSQWAESQVVPAVADKLATTLLNTIVKGLWPDRDKDAPALKPSPETSAALTKVLMGGVAMAVGNLLPVIMKGVPDAVNQAYPQLGTMHDLRIDEAAFEMVGEEKGPKGTPAHPLLQELVDSGALARALKAYDGKTFDRDPVKNRAEKIRMAYLKASGERANPAALATAARKGAQVTEKANQRAAAGRMTPGGSKGTFAQPRPDAGRNLMDALGALDGDKFGAAIAASAKK